MTSARWPVIGLVAAGLFLVLAGPSMAEFYLTEECRINTNECNNMYPSASGHCDTYATADCMCEECSPECENCDTGGHINPANICVTVRLEEGEEKKICTGDTSLTVTCGLKRQGNCWAGHESWRYCYCAGPVGTDACMLPTCDGDIIP